MQANLEEIYQALIEERGLENDSNQLQLIKTIDPYKNYLEERYNSTSLLKKFFRSLYPKQEVNKNGIYIYGDVGRGKSMIMDLFYNNLNLKKKQRIHFYQFMLDFHGALHAYLESNQNVNGDIDHVILLAEKIAGEVDVLCLDELQINNIADAMIVGRLFQALIENGTFIVITSNCAPDELFKDGLQRERFLPFIDITKEKLVIFHLNNFKDYRLSKLTSLEKSYFYPSNQESDNSEDFKEVIELIIGQNKLERKELTVDNNRILKLERVYRNVVVFTFNELCFMPLGTIDYVTIIRNFNTLIIEDIPQLGNDNHNEALRFITLIDCLYENHTRLICFAAAPVDQIYNGTKNQFEFKRTISRLKEMQSIEYITYSH